MARDVAGARGPQLERGRPFFVDIVRQGIALYEAEGFCFTSPRDLPPDEARAEAQLHFDKWFPSAREFAGTAEFAMEGLAAARERVPDYSPTLAEITGQLSAARKTIEQVAQSPAARLSPASLAEAINKASSDVRAEDRRLIADGRDALSRSLGQVDGLIRRKQTTDSQHKRVAWSAGAGALAGMLLWSILPGMVARSLPASWHVPEWMAARTIGEGVSAAELRKHSTR